MSSSQSRSELSPSQFQELLVKHGKTAPSLSVAEVIEAERLVEAWKLFQKESVATMLVENAGMPVLWQHSVDTTPVAIRSVLQKQSGTLKYQGSGKSTKDLLVQQVFLSTINAKGARIHKVLFREPLVLEHGKTTAALTACALQCPGMNVRPASESSICISHQVGDRAIPKGTRMAISGQRVLSMQSRGSESEEASGKDSIRHWQTSVGCAAHDLHNSLRWAHQVVFDHPKDVLTNLYVAMSSFKTAQVVAASSLGAWLDVVICPKDPSLCPPVPDLEILYDTLLVDADLKSILLQTQLHWDPKAAKLCISDVYMADAQDWSADISTVILSACSFVRFTASRWLTLGSSCRQWLLASILGFQHLFQHLKTTGALTPWASSGGDKMGDAEKQFCAVVGLCSHVSESCLAIALEDCRLALHSTLLQESISEETEKLQQVPDTVWAVLGPLVALTSKQLRNKVLWGAAVSASYVQYRLLNVLQNYPWCLAVGDLETNLKELRDLDYVPDNDVAAKVQTMLQGQYPLPDLCQAVALLFQCSFTSTFTEKQHASSALVKKQHPELTSKVLVCRGYLHTCRMLIPAALSPEERAIASLRRQLDRLRGKKPHNISGRHVYYASMTAKARSNNEKRRQSGQKPLNYQTIMKLHAQYWAELPEAKKDMFQRQALTLQGERVAEQQQLQMHLAKEASERQRQEALRKVYACDSMTISHCRLDDKDIADFCGLWNSDESLSRGKVGKLRESSLLCPPPVSEEAMHALISASPLEEDMPRATSATYKAVARARSNFAQSVFGIPEGPDEFAWYRLVFATLQPIRLFFQALELSEQSHTSTSPLKSDWGEQLEDDLVAHWTCGDLFGTQEDIFERVVELLDVPVFLETTFMGKSSVGSLDVPVPLAVLLRETGEQQTDVTHGTDKQRQTRHASSSKADRSPAWLHADLEKTPALAGGSAAMASACLHEQMPSDALAEPDADAEYAALLEDLEADKHAQSLGQDDWKSDFMVHLLGGQWQMERSGRLKYGLRFDLKPNSPLFIFAEKFSLPKSASFDDRAYGESLGHLLGSIWMERHKQLFEVWTEHECPEHYPVSDIPALVLSQEQSAGIKDLKGTQLKRAQYYVSLSPGDARRKRAAQSSGK